MSATYGGVPRAPHAHRTRLQPDGVRPQQGHLLDDLVEVVVCPPLDQPQLREASDHRSQRHGGEGRIDAGVGLALVLEAADGALGPVGEVLLAPDPGVVHRVVVPGHLLDHAHDGTVVAVALEVPAVGPPDRLDLGALARAVGLVGAGAVGRRELRLLGLGDLAEDLLLGLEVVVEGPVGEPRPLGDVGDAGVEEPGLLEHRLCRVE